MKRQVFRVCMLASMLMTACTTPRHGAPVVEHPAAIAPAEAPKAVVPAAQKPAADRGYYVVQKGDTLIRIALEFGQNYHDLIAWNNLSDPNDIKVDQVLRVQPPEAGTTVVGMPAGQGVQTGSVTPPASEVKPLAPPVPNKTAPKGDKRIYSDATLAELQKPDSGLAPAVPVVPAPAVGKPAEVLATIPGEEPISWIWPVEGKLLAPFDESRKGIDIAGKLGQPVLAAAAGKVMYANSIRGYGNLVIVKNAANIVSAYAHNSAILVKEGQMVTRGQKIAEMGSTDADSVQLHFEIRQQGKPVDPTKLLPSR